MACAISDLRAYLLGSWRISRRIWDFQLGISGRLEGCVTIAPGAGGLVQNETGSLVFGAHRGEATRRYRIVFDAPQAASVHHEDGRLFHTLDLSSGTMDIQHQCGGDHYRGRYRVLHDNCFLVTWHVTGSRKRYRLATRHVRMMPET